MYSANASMENTCFSSGDGDMLIVPEHGMSLLVLIYTHQEAM